MKRLRQKRRYSFEYDPPVDEVAGVVQRETLEAMRLKRRSLSVAIERDALERHRLGVGGSSVGDVSPGGARGANTGGLGNASCPATHHDSSEAAAS